ncbi:hypothetical protein D3OALGA1CA_5103 [Olavius algarvensis associated proteobacterium Delta 3]|nr:hypothetical protein D3OALGA1CA_5103 [Olavius algarvensis associated proteobacterium Delta 3]
MRYSIYADEISEMVPLLIIQFRHAGLDPASRESLIYWILL